MRITLLLLVAFGWTLLGSTCLPLELPQDETPPATTDLGVTIQSPTADATVPEGTVLTIRWTALNTTSRPGSARLYVESREDLTQTTLVEGVEVAGGSVTTSTTWDTTGFGGPYVIYAEVETADQSASTSSDGRITVDRWPTVEFLEPAEDVTYTQGGEPLTIRWNGWDPEGSGRLTLGLDPDVDPESGNEIFIHEADLGDPEAEDSLDWEGQSLLEEDVPPGTYHLFALVGDDVNGEQAVGAGVSITVEEAQEEEEEPEPLTLGIVSPAEDTTFLVTDDPLTIEYSVNEFEDSLIDLRIDTDDNHANGNELTILSQRLVPGGTETDTFDWDGTLANGDPVEPGIYRLYVLANTGGSAPETADGEALIFRRTYEDQPLMALLEPASPTTVQIGDTVTIRWRDDDPLEQGTIRLTIDDDPEPAEDAETGEAELEILSGREAAGDGSVLDKYFWQVPGTLAPGTYYIFGYIADVGEEPHEEEPAEQVTVAPGLLIVEDPAGQ